MKIEEKAFLMEIARLAARRSKAIRLQVGAVVSDSVGNIIATGYNGTVRGYNNDAGEVRNYDEGPYTHKTTSGLQYKIETDHSMMIHAEENVIAHAARRGLRLEGATMIGTHSPCMKCCSLMIQTGIIEMVFAEKHRSFNDVESVYGKYIKLTFTDLKERIFQACL
jgi:dCMP deaminase